MSQAPVSAVLSSYGTQLSVLCRSAGWVTWWFAVRDTPWIKVMSRRQGGEARGFAAQEDGEYSVRRGEPPPDVLAGRVAPQRTKEDVDVTPGGTRWVFTSVSTLSDSLAGFCRDRWRVRPDGPDAIDPKDVHYIGELLSGGTDEDFDVGTLGTGTGRGGESNESVLLSIDGQGTPTCGAARSTAGPAIGSSTSARSARRQTRAGPNGPWVRTRPRPTSTADRLRRHHRRGQERAPGDRGLRACLASIGHVITTSVASRR